MAVAERREAEPTKQHRSEVKWAVRQGTIKLFNIGCELPPVILQANQRVLQESRRAIATHNEIS